MLVKTQKTQKTIWIYFRNINEKFGAVLKNRISELANSVYFDEIIKFIGFEDKKKLMIRRLK